jgi:GNAT superfamily N-acetyltransferase
VTAPHDAPGISSVRYRPANFDDCRALAEMRWDFRVEEAPDLVIREDRLLFVGACQQWIRRVISLGTWTVWVAEDGGRIVAHAFVQLVEKVPKPGRIVDRYGYLTNVYTRPDYRGRGVGSGLMDWVKWWALGADLEFLIVWPAEDAVTFYERADFEPEAEALVFTLRPDHD